MTCPHNDMSLAAQPYRTDDGGMILMLHDVRCNHCGHRFVFKGILPGLGFPSQLVPTMRPDGIAATLPLEEKAA